MQCPFIFMRLFGYIFQKPQAKKSRKIVTECTIFVTIIIIEKFVRIN